MNTKHIQMRITWTCCILYTYDKWVPTHSLPNELFTSWYDFYACCSLEGFDDDVTVERSRTHTYHAISWCVLHARGSERHHHWAECHLNILLFIASLDDSDIKHRWWGMPVHVKSFICRVTVIMYSVVRRCWSILWTKINFNYE